MDNVEGDKVSSEADQESGNSMEEEESSTAEPTANKMLDMLSKNHLTRKSAMYNAFLPPRRC